MAASTVTRVGSGSEYEGTNHQEASRREKCAHTHTHTLVCNFLSFSYLGAEMHKSSWKSRRPGRRSQRQNPRFRQHSLSERQVQFPRFPRFPSAIPVLPSPGTLCAPHKLPGDIAAGGQPADHTPSSEEMWPCSFFQSDRDWARALAIG